MSDAGVVSLNLTFRPRPAFGVRMRLAQLLIHLACWIASAPVGDIEVR